DANPTFAGVNADAINIGITAASEIDTDSGNLTLDSASGTVLVDDQLRLALSLYAPTGTFAFGGADTKAYNAIGDTTTGMSHSLGSDDDLYIEGDLEVDGAAWFDGSVTVAGNMTLTGHLIPGANDTYDLGSTTARWRDLYLGAETLHIGTSLTDEGAISYDTTGNLFNFSTDATTNADIAFFTNDLYLDKSAGNVGINTTSPDRKLDILDASNPQLRLSQADVSKYVDFQATSSGDIVINSNAGQLLRTDSDDYNVFLGTDAGINNTDYYNTGVGYNALYYNTTGDGNTALGYLALNANIDSYNNTGIGYYTLSLNTTGDENVGLGGFALYSNTTGHNNIGLGGFADYGFAPFTWTYLSATAVAGSGLNIGTYYYKMSFVLDGAETVLSDPGEDVTTTGGNQAVNLAGIRTYSGSLNCTARKIYRTKTADSGVSQTKPYYLLTTINNNSTTTYSDTTPDVSLGAVYDGPDSSIVIGYNAQALTSNQFVVGSADAPINQMYLGEGIISATPQDLTINTTGGNGTNIAGGNLIFAGGKGTGNAAGGYISFKTSDAGASGTPLQSLTEKMRLTTGGNLGIGTTSPDTLLEVYGSSNKLRLSSNDTYYTDLSTGSSGDLTINPTGGNVLFADNDTLAIGGALGQSYNVIGDTTTGMSHSLGSDDDLYIEGDLEVDGAAWFDGSVTVAGNMTLTGHLIPGANDTYDLGSTTARWRDLYLGAETLHIGTSLTDEGAISYDTTGNLFNFSTDATTNADIAFFTNDLYLDKSTSYVGIGTTAPASALDIKGGALATEGVDLVTNGTFVADSGWDTGPGWTTTGGIATKVAGTASNLSQNLGEAASKMYHITFDYTRTAGTLTVSIGGVTHSTSYTSASGSGDIYVYSSGTGDLTFIADATFAGTVDNVVVKEVSASLANTTNRDSAGTISNELRAGGTGTTFMGVDSGKFNLAGGLANSAFGGYTLRSNTTGDYNSAMGLFALRDNTTGVNNSAMGYGALIVNTTGYNNSAMGYQALYANTTGDHNSAMGMWALYSNTTGKYNSAMGAYTLYANTTGSYNSAIGRTALGYNATGSGNVAMGHFAGLGVAGGSNISNSVLVGNDAGKALLTGGDNNILLGYGAGDNLTTGAKNIIIGYNIDATAATSANTLNIGNLIFGTGLTGDGATSAGNIGIGTTTPGQKLSIYSNSDFMGLYDASGNMQAQILSSTGTTNRQLMFNFPGVTGVGGAGDNWFGMRFNGASNKIFFGETGSVAWMQTNHQLQFRVGGGSIPSTANIPQVVIDTSGNVGIGDTTGDAKLDILASQTSGILEQISYEGAATLAGSLTGLDLDLSTNVTPSTYNITGLNMEVPSGATGDMTFAKFIEGSSTLYDFDVTTAQFNVPASFNNAGDVSLAYDLIMTNNSAGYIKFNGPGYVQTSDASGNYDLTLSAANLGAVTVADLFEVSDSTSGTLVTINETGTGPILDIQKSGASKLYMKNDGNVGIGTSTPDNLLSLGKVSGDPILDFRIVNTTKFSMGVDDSDSDKFKIEAAATLGGATPAFVITSTGAIGIGTSAPGTKFVIKSIDTSASAANMFIDTTTGSVYRSTSSLRYKDDVQTLQDDFTKILEARPTSFIDKATGRRDIGFIAEEFDALGLSNLVVYDEQGRPDAIKYERISLYQNEVLKEQQQKLSVMDSDLQLVKNDLGLGASDSTSLLTSLDLKIDGLESGIGNQELGMQDLESRILGQESRIQDLESRISGLELENADTAPAQMVEGASSEQVVQTPTSLQTRGVDLESLQSTLQILVDSLSNLENVSNQLNTLSASILTVMESNQANTARIDELEKETQNLQQIVKIVEDKVVVGDPNKYLVLDAATGLEINSENFSLDKDGNVKVKGELRLSSGKITSETGILELNPAPREGLGNPGEASDTVPEPKVVVKGKEMIVEGDLKVGGKIIAGASDTQAAENKSIITSKGVIKAGEKEAIIETEAVSEDSFIGVTPLSAASLYVSEIRSEANSETSKQGFTVSALEPAKEDIQFNWWVIIDKTQYDE
ncbi:MAG: hypothetical protein WC650_00005, partial [Candidatus Doudnabacteria bacterium]